MGFLPFDPVGAQGLWAGVMTRRFAGSDLVRSTRSVAQSVLTSWPSLIPTVTPAPDPGGAAAGSDETLASTMEGSGS